jgi:hypothetical protein
VSVIQFLLRLESVEIESEYNGAWKYDDDCILKHQILTIHWTQELKPVSNPKPILSL